MNYWWRNGKNLRFQLNPKYVQVKKTSLHDNNICHGYMTVFGFSVTNQTNSNYQEQNPANYHGCTTVCLKQQVSHKYYHVLQYQKVLIFQASHIYGVLNMPVGTSHSFQSAEK